MPGRPHPRRDDQPRLVAELPRRERAPHQLAAGRPDGRRVRLPRRVRVPRPRGRQGRHRRDHDDLAGLVAGGLRPLRPAVHPDGVAQRRHLPHLRRPWRRRHRPAALRAAQLLAGQRQPRQGPPPALAGEEEVRRQALLGRPDDPRGQLRPRVDGLRDLRLRRRSCRRLGAGERELGRGDRVAGRRPLHRRPPAREPAGCGPDGPHLRQPRGSQRRAERARRSARHPRDLRAHGHERRGDRRPHRRWSHLRQDPRRRRPEPVRRSRAGGGAARRAGPGLEELARHRQRRVDHHQRPRGHLDADPDHLGQQLLRDAVRLRLGPREEPRRREPVDPDRPHSRRVSSSTRTTRRGRTRR